MADFTSPEDEHFFAAIGWLTISWAHVEAGVDFAIDVIHRCLGGIEIEREMPRTSIYRKLRYIRKWSNRLLKKSLPSFRKPRSGCPESILPVEMIRKDMGLWIPGSRLRRAPE